MANNALVIGFGVSGRSASEWLLGNGWKVYAVDRQAEEQAKNNESRALLAKGVLLSNENTPLDVGRFQLAVISPGIPLTHPLVLQAKGKGIEVVGEIELALRTLQAPLLAITGTNGKTTATLLTTYLLQAAGKKAKALGNIGVPFASESKTLEKEAYGILELSSYQIETLATPRFRHGVILNITPDHLDRYGTMEAYAKAKIALKNYLEPQGKFIVYESTYQEYKPFFEGYPCLRYGYDPKLEVYADDTFLYHKGLKVASLPVKLQGRKNHDLENFMAAAALCYQEGLSWEEMSVAYESFQKPSHRLQYILTIKERHFVDDSKGTNIDAVIRAVESLSAPIHLIAGGVHKGASYEVWRNAFRGKVKSVALIGQASEQIANDLKPDYECMLCRSMDEAVRICFKNAKEGELVLLSPGCSSFDMFKDYADRGNKFREIAEKIRRECETNE